MSVCSVHSPVVVVLIGVNTIVDETFHIIQSPMKRGLAHEHTQLIAAELECDVGVQAPHQRGNTVVL